MISASHTIIRHHAEHVVKRNYDSVKIAEMLTSELDGSTKNVFDVLREIDEENNGEYFQIEYSLENYLDDESYLLNQGDEIGEKCIEFYDAEKCKKLLKQGREKIYTTFAKILEKRDSA